MQKFVLFLLIMSKNIKVKNNKILYYLTIYHKFYQIILS